MILKQPFTPHTHTHTHTQLRDLHGIHDFVKKDSISKVIDILHCIEIIEGVEL